MKYNNLLRDAEKHEKQSGTRLYISKVESIGKMFVFFTWKEVLVMLDAKYTIAQTLVSHSLKELLMIIVVNQKELLQRSIYSIRCPCAYHIESELSTSTDSNWFKIGQAKKVSFNFQARVEYGSIQGSGIETSNSTL